MSKSFRLIYVSLIYSILIIFSTANAADWVTYRGDSARGGITTEQLETSLSLRWKFVPTHAPRPAWMKPAEELQRMHFDSAYHVSVVNNTVYFGSSVDNKVYAVDAKTGDIKWAFFTEGPVRFAPAVWKDRVYFGSDDGHVYCLKAKDGKPIWKYRAGPSDEKIIGNGRMISLWPVRTSVLVDDGIVYFGAGVFPYEGIYICALKADDGAVIWKNDTIGDKAHELSYGGISPQSYLVASENVLYVPSGRAMPAAFDRESGRFMYYCSTSGKSGGTWALVAEGELIAGVDSSGTPTKVAFDEKTGKRKGGAYAWFPGIDMIVTPKVAYTLSREGIHAIDRTAYPEASAKLSSLRTEREELGAILSDLRGKLSRAAEESQAAADTAEEPQERLDSQVDKITERIEKITSEEEILLKTLACKWQYIRKDLHSLILAGNTIFAGGKEIIIAIDTETGEETWKSEIDGIALGLAASNGNLFVSTDKGPIYCFGQSEESEAKEIKPDIKNREKKQIDTYKTAVDTIKTETGIEKGFCLVLDAGDGQLAYELARQTELKIIALGNSPQKIQEARNNLDKAGIYGSRVVIEQWDISSLPDYFANLIISDASIVPRKCTAWSSEMLRVLRPYGGVVYVPNISSWIPMPDDGCEIKESSIKNVVMAVRGKLEGAGSWRQLYANPQNTACGDDQLVKTPLGLLWFGEPGPARMVERHGRAESPVSIDGRFFVQGAEIIMAYDAYNGTMLWQREIPGAVRVRVDVDGGNMVATENGLYVAIHDKCCRLNPATGETMQVYRVPLSPDGTSGRWGYISFADNILFGSSSEPLMQEYAAAWKSFVQDGIWIGEDKLPAEYITEYRELKKRYPIPNEDAWLALQRAGGFWALMGAFPSWGGQNNPGHALTNRMMVSDSIFAIDTKTGKQLWVHSGEAIANIIPTVADGKIFLAEAKFTETQKEEAFIQKQKQISSGIYWESSEAEVPPDDVDVRLVMALDATTGEKLWEKPIDLTGCGGDKVGSAYHDGLLLFFGHFSNHDGGWFRENALTWRRITALEANTGNVVWSRPLNYLRRPVIIGDKIIIEPRACDLHTGEIKTRSHPITNQQVPWEFLRPGHSCSVTSATPNAMFYRSYCHAIYDLAEDRGIGLFGGIRPGCWLSPIAANGLVISPETSSGCTCSFPIRSTFVMTHKKRKRPKEWTVFITHGAMTPVKEFSINFGAPGDIRDDSGAMWFGYPRPKAGYGVKFNLKEAAVDGMGPYCYDFKGAEIDDTDMPWLFTSGYLGLRQCKIPLIDSTWGEKPGIYTVRLGFMPLSGDRIEDRVFSIKLQGDSVLENFDIRKAAKSINKVVIKEFSGIQVKDDLVVELIPKFLYPTIRQAPIVNFIQIVRDDTNEILTRYDYAKTIEITQANSMLEMAETELDNGNESKALELYHAISDAAPNSELRVEALKGMTAIGSPESLSKIARYCRDTNPILWDYRQPDKEVHDEAIKVYIAIADNMMATNKRQSIKMLKHALAMVNDLALRQRIVTALEKLGIKVDENAAKADL